MKVLYFLGKEIVLFEFRLFERLVASRTFYDHKFTFSSQVPPTVFLTGLAIDTHGEPRIFDIFGVEMPSEHDCGMCFIEI